MYRVCSFDFYLDVTDLTLNPNLQRLKMKNLHFWSNLSSNSFVKSINFSHFKNMLIFGMGWAVWISTCPLQMDRQTEGQTYSSNYNIDIKGYGAVKITNFGPILLQIALLSPFLDENSKSVLKFGIEWTVLISTWMLQT